MDKPSTAATHTPLFARALFLTAGRRPSTIKKRGMDCHQTAQLVKSARMCGKQRLATVWHDAPVNFSSAAEVIVVSRLAADVDNAVAGVSAA